MDGRQTLARTAWGENRGGGVPGLQSVMNVCMNRVAKQTWYGLNVIEVCLKNENGIYQFDCWMPTDPNYKLIIGTLVDALFLKALGMADRALAGNLPDITNGAVNYFAKTMATPPKWSLGKQPCADIGGQLFYKEG